MLIKFNLKKRPTHNPELQFIKDDWKGNFVNHKNQYVNLIQPSERSYKDLFKWFTSKNKFKSRKKNQQSPFSLPSGKINFNERQDGIIYLGHATFLFTINGKNIITDPVLFDVGPVKRNSPLPCKPEDITAIDYILISHNHRDHLDKKSLKLICKLNPNATILTALQISTLLKQWKVKNKIIEAGWYQTYSINEAFNIHLLPAKHWNRRGLFDLNQMLWGSFFIQSNVKCIYFGADSGYCVHFKEIGKLFSKIDYAILGIGACEPEWFMRTSHTSPKKAYEAFEDLRAKQLIPMHYGTFDLSDEPLSYPEEELKKLITQTDKKEQVLFPQLGNKMYF